MTALVLASTYFRNAERISIYLSTANAELRTDELIHAAFRERALFLYGWQSI